MGALRSWSIVLWVFAQFACAHEPLASLAPLAGQGNASRKQANCCGCECQQFPCFGFWGMCPTYLDDVSHSCSNMFGSSATDYGCFTDDHGSQVCGYQCVQSDTGAISCAETPGGVCNFGLDGDPYCYDTTPPASSGGGGHHWD